MRYVLAVVLSLFVLLLLQNLASVEVNFLLWSFSLPKMLLLLLVFFLGGLTGYGLAWFKKTR